MCDVYSIWSIFLYFCRDFWTEILPIEAFCVGWNQYNRILHDKSSSIFPPESPYANIFQQANTKNPTLFSRQLSHPRVYVWCLGLGHIYFQVFADVTKGRYHQTLLLPLTPHDLWLAEMHHKNYLFYHSNYFWFKHGKTLA